jgi:putrescine aminotransferase
VFSASGSEAIDVAIKTARRATGRRRIVTLAAGFHGRTGLAGAAGQDTGAAYFLSDLPAEFTKVAFADSEAIGRELAKRDVAAC